MNLRLRLLLATLAVAVCSSANAQQQTIAFWDFEAVVGQDEAPQIVVLPSIGSGTLYQQRADTDGNGKGGTPFTDAALGIDVGASRAIAWDDFGKSGDNDGEFFAVVSTTGFENIQISFDYRGNDDNLDGEAINIADGFTRFDAKYTLADLVDEAFSFDGGLTSVTIKDFGVPSIDLLTNVTVTNDSVNYQRIVLTAPAAANNQDVFSFRLDDFEGNESVRFDNFLISGTPITAAAICGDINLDGSVSFLDIAPFIALLSSQSFQAEADCDVNGVVNFLDIAPFISALAAN